VTCCPGGHTPGRASSLMAGGPDRVSALVTRLGFGLARPARAAPVWGALLATAAIAWTVTVRDALAMGNGPGTMGRGVAGFVVMWVACAIPGYERHGHELVAEENAVEDGPFAWALSGNCAYTSDFDYRGP
jgi:hypothetical protein